jgi:RNA polymerase sigma-70 factor, ECF subfamily
MSTQRELVEGAVAGDHDAFVTLARAAYPRLNRIAQLILRDDDLAADAVQEALTSAWLHIRAVREPDRFDAWLYRLTVRASHLEARRRKGGLIELVAGGVDPADARDDLRTVDVRDRVERGFRRLKPDERAVLVVHHYLQLGDAEAAAVLGIPLGTMKSRLNRATAALRASIEADDRGPVQTTEVPA